MTSAINSDPVCIALERSDLVEAVTPFSNEWGGRDYNVFLTDLARAPYGRRGELVLRTSLIDGGDAGVEIHVLTTNGVCGGSLKLDVPSLSPALLATIAAALLAGVLETL